MSCNSPVLLIVFNRPDSTERVFEAIRHAQPAMLFVAADGPRVDRLGEADICALVRSIVDRVDWPCELRTLFHEKNLGCKRAVSSAIDWFFENVDQGIILEDDCLPNKSFFPFCDELLDRYADDSSIAQICGSSFIPASALTDSYYFTKYADIWGWATWRRAWQLADMNMENWPTWRDSDGLKKLSGSTAGFVDYWQQIFDRTHAGEIDTWDYQWMYTCWRLGLRSIQPQKMQIQNIGFDANATHTSTDIPNYVTDPVILDFPLRHPSDTSLNPVIEIAIAKRRYHLNRLHEGSVQIKRIPIFGQLLVYILKYLRERVRSATSIG